MSIQEDFKAFLSDIEPSKSTVESISSAQNALRSYLENDDDYASHYEDSFLSGSYGKHTSIRPAKDDDNRDVDIVILTDHDTNDCSSDVIIELRDALEKSERYKSAHLQTHSVGINLSKLDIDVVPLAGDGDKRYIGCIDDGDWKETDPKGHIEWSTQVNKDASGKYKPVVKIMKWWRRENCPADIKWPKGITLEKMIADCFPSDNSNYEDILVELFENLKDEYADEVDREIVPRVEDPSVPDNNLAEGYEIADFRSFLKGISSSLEIIQEEGSCNESWRKVLGSRFPSATSNAETSTDLADFTTVEAALAVKHRQRPTWPISAKKPSVIVVADVTYPDGHTERISNNGSTIPKGCDIDYRVMRSRTLSQRIVKWEVVNTGKEAYDAGCPRGEFNDSNISNGGRHEETAYRGRHFVKAYVLKSGRCIAYSKEFFINVE